MKEIIIGNKNIISNNMINETIADMLADISLRTFNPKLSNGMTINQMLRTPYEKWSIHSPHGVSGYAKYVPLLQLLILAFQNEKVNYNNLYSKLKVGICSDIKTKLGLRINDFLYGIIFDYSHITNIWNRFMGDKISFDEFSKKSDELFKKRHITYDKEKITEIMQYIAAFANIKNKYNLRNGIITPQTNESLRTDFNTLWNQLMHTYDLLPNRVEGPSIND